MPKLKPMKFSDYSNDDLTFHHDQELKSLIVTLRVENKLKHNGHKFVISVDHLDVYIECNDLNHFIIGSADKFEIVNASLSSRVGKWSPEAKTSHTMIDKTTLFTLLKLLS